MMATRIIVTGVLKDYYYYSFAVVESHHLGDGILCK